MLVGQRRSWEVLSVAYAVSAALPTSGLPQSLRLAHDARDIGWPKRLPNERHAMPISFGAEPPHDFGQLKSAQTRHIDVRHKDIDTIVRFESAQSLASIARGNDTENILP